MQPLCPDEAELFPLSTGEEVSPNLADHVAACQHCQGLLRQMRNEVTALRSAMSDLRESLATSPLVQSPRGDNQFGPYVLIGTLREDDDLTIYRAVHGTLGQELQLAIGKQPLPPDHPAREQWLDLGKRLVQIDHPHLARSLDAGFLNNRPFLAEDCIEGEKIDLALLTKKEKQPFLDGLLAALEALHADNVAHGSLSTQPFVRDATRRPRLVHAGLAALRRVGKDQRLEVAQDLADLNSLLDLPQVNNQGSQSHVGQLRRTLAQQRRVAAWVRWGALATVAALGCLALLWGLRHVW